MDGKYSEIDDEAAYRQYFETGSALHEVLTAEIKRAGLQGMDAGDFLRVADYQVRKTGLTPSNAGSGKISPVMLDNPHPSMFADAVSSRAITLIHEQKKGLRQEVQAPPTLEA